VSDVLRWLLPAIVPAVLAAWLVHRSDKNREPPRIVIGTFLFAALLAGGAMFLERKATVFTGLDARVSAAGGAGSLVFLFFFVAPMREALKVAAVWPAFSSKHFDEPYDGIVYASTAALGFACVENAVILHDHPTGGIWIARALVALPAHVFFATTWGYALGRAKQAKRPGAIFWGAWLVATIAHALYEHFVWGRGPGALVGTIPLLFGMGVLAWFARSDLQQRGERPSRFGPGQGGSRLSRVSFYISQPPSLRTVRAALRRADQPIMIRWIVLGAFVTMGAMLAGLAGSIAAGHWLAFDFSAVDERDVSTTAPVLLLGSGVLLAFPFSGFLIARASGLPTLLEPALASALALVLVMIALGLAAPIALVFGLAFSPILWGLACFGAWIGRPAR
jgi:RsiW-degrading membrane proteinase PrsW (M82 family)